MRIRDQNVIRPSPTHRLTGGVFQRGGPGLFIARLVARAVIHHNSLHRAAGRVYCESSRGLDGGSGPEMGEENKQMWSAWQIEANIREIEKIDWSHVVSLDRLITVRDWLARADSWAVSYCPGMLGRIGAAWRIVGR